MQQYITIYLKNKKSRNTVIGYMEKYFGNNGLAFIYNLKTDKEREKIMLKIPWDDNFTNTINKFKNRGICDYMVVAKPIDFVYKGKSRAVLELATETVRLLSSLFGH